VINGVVYPVAATITAASALATAGYTRKILKRVERHDRALYGAEQIEDWNGVVPKVNRIVEVLEEEDYL